MARRKDMDTERMDRGLELVLSEAIAHALRHVSGSVEAIEAQVDASFRRSWTRFQLPLRADHPRAVAAFRHAPTCPRRAGLLSPSAEPCFPHGAVECPTCDRCACGRGDVA